MESQIECNSTSLRAAAGKYLRSQQVVEKGLLPQVSMQSGLVPAMLGVERVTGEVTPKPSLQLHKHVAAWWDISSASSSFWHCPRAASPGATCTLGGVLTVQHQGGHQLSLQGTLVSHSGAEIQAISAGQR